MNRVEDFEERVSIMVESGIPVKKALVLASQDNAEKWAAWLAYIVRFLNAGWSMKKINRFLKEKQNV